MGTATYVVETTTNQFISTTYYWAPNETTPPTSGFFPRRRRRSLYPFTPGATYPTLLLARHSTPPWDWSLRPFIRGVNQGADGVERRMEVQTFIETRYFSAPTPMVSPPPLPEKPIPTALVTSIPDISLHSL